jgi:membrane-anchored protein YejM (alkaline phosphatase superfamily)
MAIGPMKKNIFLLILNFITILFLSYLLSELRIKYALDSIKGQDGLLTVGFLHDIKSLLILSLIIALLKQFQSTVVRFISWALFFIFILYNGFGWGFYSSIGLFPDSSSLTFASNYAGTYWLLDFIFSYETNALLTGGSVMAILCMQSILSVLSFPTGKKYKVIYLFLIVCMHLATVHTFQQLKTNHQFTQATREQFYSQGLGPLTAFRKSFFAPRDLITNEKELVASLKSSLTPRIQEINKMDLTDTPSVILLSIESLLPDAHTMFCNDKNKRVMPFLYSLSKKSILFEHAYAPSSHSDYSDPAIYASRLPIFGDSHVYFSPTDPWPRPIIHTSLKQHSYKTAHFSSQNESWGGMRYFFPKDKMDVFFDPESTDLPTYLEKKDSGAYRGLIHGVMTKGNLYDNATTDAAISWIKEHAHSPFIVSLNFQTTHFPYKLPPDEEPYCGEAILDKGISFGRYPDNKIPLVKKAYYNALHSVDRHLKNLVLALDEMNITENTLIVIYGDNGESFGTQGLYSHGSFPYEDQVRVFLSFTLPKKLSPGNESSAVSLLDIAPSIYQLILGSEYPDFQGSNILKDAGTVKVNRTIWMHVDSPLAFSDGIMVNNRWKYFINLKKRSEFLFDLKNDPEEKINLIEECTLLTARLREEVKNLRLNQQLYYTHTSLHQKYYPPKLIDITLDDEIETCTRINPQLSPAQ